jgi:ribose 5-phosphate isomerase RpiB
VKLVISSDHAGFSLKEDVRDNLVAAGHEVVDLGAYKVEPEDDYPDFAKKVGESIKAGVAPPGDSHLRIGSRGVRCRKQDSRHSRRDLP